jgi:Siderophore synthetase component
MKLRSLIWYVLVLLGLSVQAWALEPIMVSKQATNIEIPPGMHLVIDRTGQKWLLPEGMDTPPEREVEIKYFKTKIVPQEIGRIGTHTVLSSPISALDTVVSENRLDPNNLMERLPEAMSDVMYLEKHANLHAHNSPDLQSLGVFGPAKFITFKVPYIPIPKSEMEFAKVSNYASGATKELVEFEKDGVKYVRFFIHPNYVDSYQDLISKFGIVYHYEGLSSSSPRSLIVMDPEDSKREESKRQVHWVKVSLHRKIDGSVRINTDKKARRAIIMSEAIAEVPTENMKSYNLAFMLEPAAFQPKGKIASTIHREVPRDFLYPAKGIKWVPAFILQNTDGDAVPKLNLQDMLRISGEQPEKFIAERLIRPLLKGYLSMGLREGLPGELHTQNFYYQVKATKGGYLPTGEVLFKDNDGFRYDTELALRQGRSMDFFAQFPEPFIWGKFSNTLGLGAEGVPFLGSWYYKLIRNVNGFETLSAYMLRVLTKINPEEEWSKDRIQKLFDKIAMEEAAKITGITIAQEDYGFQKDKGLNKVLNTFRANLSLAAESKQMNDPEWQEKLRAEWDRLKTLDRVSALRRTLGKDVYFVARIQYDYSVIIEARTKKVGKSGDPTIGFAMEESPMQNKQRPSIQIVNEMIQRGFEPARLSCGRVFKIAL